MAEQPNNPPLSLRVLSLNCWGLKYIAKLRNERLAEIGDQIAAATPLPDIVGLQECWTQQDYNVIRDKTRHFLPYGKFYHSGIFGGGLVILSRWPIEESSMLRYPLNGRPAAFYRGDWFVGKGVACARIRMGPTRRDIAEVFCTHLHAPYESEPHDSYLCHRTAQAWEITKLMRGAAERGHLVIGLGDFNMIPLSLAHRIIETHSPVRDVWRILHPDSSVGAARDKVEQLRGVPMPNAEFNITNNGATCDSELNSWRWNEAHKRRLAKGENVHIDPTVPDPNAKRLDYIFFSSETRHDASTGEQSADWTLQEANVGMTMRHPTLHCSLSDHFSVEATFIRNASEPLSAASHSLSTAQERFLPIETYDEILANVAKYDARERIQRKLRLGHFGYQLFLSVGCLVGVWWSPHNYVSFILMLISSLGLSLGVLEGLMGGLFVGSELRALNEFEWEVRTTRERALATSGKSALDQHGLHLTPHTSHLKSTLFPSRNFNLQAPRTAATMSNPQPQGSQGAARPAPPQVLKAEDIAKLLHLSDDSKQKYRPVLQNFWHMINSKPPNSPEWLQARQKLEEWSGRLIQQERQFRAKGRPQPGNQVQQGQSSQQNQPAQSNQQTSSGLQQQQPSQSQASDVSQQSKSASTSQSPMNPDIVKHVHTFPFHLPPQGPQRGTPEGEAKLKEYKNTYLMALSRQEKAAHRVKEFQVKVEGQQAKSLEVPSEFLATLAQAEKEFIRAKEFVDAFRRNQAQWKTQHEQRRAQQQQAQGHSPPAPQQPAVQEQHRPSQPIVKEEPHIKVEGEQTSRSAFAGAPQTHSSQSGQVQPLRQPPAPISQQNTVQNSLPQFTQPQQPQQQPQPHAQQQQQPPRPQINPHQANAMQFQQNNSPHPQSATSNAGGPPVALSHQAAVSAAQRSYSNQEPPRTSTPMQAGGQGNFHAPGSREREQLNNPKMPIPRTLQVSQPSPVGMGQARPTMSGPTNGAPGPMGQPVIAKFPPFQLEGEGDRVLSKRKLDELVRQVTGGSEEALTSEVEEAILQLADDFVDTVIGSACKLSKLRESPQLDIRDIQMVLERNYNIRIPGYASDEVRTVRKLIPAPGWTQKMNAVQAAKVMGGKTDI
ncbi:hypothetical protein BDV95DRAFT_533299 [Massariosphaeria phaeospora]|uniref:Transcription initiation factor TFIID subunit 12 domain-containing protein n=1 Tax=Massariosphaeria phaeospora TaxID=100035 RepID=A0A7C8MJ58_9PLEO|nr:hypothetical protein BDV95DRAFT_533299 [Massariosphaeria phaeospora]